MKILVVEDELAIANFLKEGLEEEGYMIDVANTGKEGLQLATETNTYDLLLLDWMLPTVSGIEICKAVRKDNIEIPILILTAKDNVEDIVLGLNSGANDYLKKPFSFEELLARIKVLLRPKQSEAQVYEMGDIVLNANNYAVTKAGKKVALTQKEFALLEYLFRKNGKVCRRHRIIEKIWDIHFDKDDSVIDVFINALRRKLDTNGKPSIIETIRGVGYRINN